MENAPFGVNRKQNGFLEKVCKSVLFFAHIQEMDSPEWQTGAFAGPDWRWNLEGSGSVYLRRCRVETLIYLLTEPPGFEWGGVGPAFRFRSSSVLSGIAPSPKRSGKCK